jgi:hypothetical protein
MAAESRNGARTLIPTSPRGAPTTERTTERRMVRYLDVPRLFHRDKIQAYRIYASSSARMALRVTALM